jgi:hypothetical protein
MTPGVRHPRRRTGLGMSPAGQRPTSGQQRLLSPPARDHHQVGQASSASVIGSARTRSRLSSTTTMAPSRKSASTEARLASSSAACSRADDRSGGGTGRRRLRGLPRGQQVTEVRVRCHDHTSIPSSMLEDLRIWGIQPQRLPDVDRVVTGFAQLPHDHRGHARVDQEPHPTGRSGSSRSRTASAA